VQTSGKPEVWCHPRLATKKGVDARQRRQVYAVCASLTALPGMTSAGREGGAMRVVWLAAVMAVASTLARADDMVEMVSRYRREHGLSTVKIDPQLTAIAERQAKAMAASGIMDHNVAGSFSSRMSGAHAGVAAENIAAGTKTWAETFRMWQNSPGHNANLLQARADSVGFAVARNEQTAYKTFWAMVIAEKSPNKKDGKVAAEREHRESLATADNPISAIRNFVCKYLC
jgi:uncharacterized protein YkwD